MSVVEAAEYCGNGMSPDTVRRALVTGECVGYQLRKGGKWRVRREHLDAWLMGETPDVSIPRVTRRQV